MRIRCRENVFDVCLCGVKFGSLMLHCYVIINGLKGSIINRAMIMILILFIKDLLSCNFIIVC